MCCVRFAYLLANHVGLFFPLVLSGFRAFWEAVGRHKENAKDCCGVFSPNEALSERVPFHCVGIMIPKVSRMRIRLGGAGLGRMLTNRGIFCMINVLWWFKARKKSAWHTGRVKMEE